MTEMLIGGAFGLVAPLVGGLVWLIRLEGKVNTEKALRESLSDRITSFEQRIYASLERIENKLDDKADK